MSKEVFESIKRGLEEAIEYAKNQKENPKRLTKEKPTESKKS